MVKFIENYHQEFISFVYQIFQSLSQYFSYFIPLSFWLLLLSCLWNIFCFPIIAVWFFRLKCWNYFNFVSWSSRACSMEWIVSATLSILFTTFQHLQWISLVQTVDYWMSYDHIFWIESCSSFEGKERFPVSILCEKQFFPFLIFTDFF